MSQDAVGDPGERGEVVRPKGVDDQPAQPYPGAVEVGNMFQFYAEVSHFNEVRDVDAVRDLNPRLQTFQQWLTAHKDALASASS